MQCPRLSAGACRKTGGLAFPLCAFAEEQGGYLCRRTGLQGLEGHYPAEWLVPADARSFGTEFLDYKMAIRTTDTVEEALRHIAAFGSKHSECIVTEDKEVAAYFCRRVDAACVYVNAPTSFTDGGEFGLGAEIGISTQKLHARGPMGLNEITTYKWWIEGNGQVRE